MDTMTDPGQAIDEMDQGKSLEEEPALNNLTPKASVITLESPTVAKATRSDLDTPIGLDKKVIALRSMIENDVHAADIKWSLFVAACQHYRWDSCLKPFPVDFVKDGNKDIESLLLIVSKMSNLRVLSKYLQDEECHRSESKVIDLAYWVLCRSKDVGIVSVTKPSHATILAKVPSETLATKPDWIFQVNSRVSEGNEQLWEEQTTNKLFAYHGSRLENFYSILNHGLQQHLNKNSLFGQGVYLSSELSVSLPYSPMGYSWGGSVIGSQLSCVALCEMVDHPDVKCQDKASDRSRAITRDSVGGEVPNKYYVVTNSDLVRVRYLLVYAKKQGSLLGTSSSFHWFRSHKLLTLFIAYIAMLVAVGMSNNTQVMRFIKTLRKNAETNYNTFMNK